MEYLPITIQSDEKGYFDRKCPNENCHFIFKVHMEDWKTKFIDYVHCPMCGHTDTTEGDKWWTQQQLESMQELFHDYALSYIQGELDKFYASMERATRRNKFLKITYKPGKRVSFINNPIGQMSEWETDITCEACGTRYSVIGSAYFCPCCGHNSAESVFEESMDSVEKMVASLPQLRELFTNLYGQDKADTMCRDMLEGTLGDVVSAFQKFAECVYTRKSTTPVKVNDFQIVQKGSKLFRDATGKGYDTWLTAAELDRMNLLFQRRHILEHNAGLVDNKYLQNSGDASYVLGQRLVVHEKDAYELLAIIKKLAAGLKTL